MIISNALDAPSRYGKSKTYCNLQIVFREGSEARWKMMKNECEIKWFESNE